MMKTFAYFHVFLLSPQRPLRPLDHAIHTRSIWSSVYFFVFCEPFRKWITKLFDFAITFTSVTLFHLSLNSTLNLSRHPFWTRFSPSSSVSVTCTKERLVGWWSGAVPSSHVPHLSLTSISSLDLCSFSLHFGFFFGFCKLRINDGLVWWWSDYFRCSHPLHLLLTSSIFTRHVSSSSSLPFEHELLLFPLTSPP